MLENIGSTIMILLGLISLFKPVRMGNILGLEIKNQLGVSEIRATYGGFFIALGIMCFIFNLTNIFIVVGVSWTGAFIVRFISAILDKGFSYKNIIGMGIEFTMGVLFLFNSLKIYI